MEFVYKITVFTPTYNRAYTLEALYRSLQRQTFHDFEWLIVDDGSTDGTEELVNKWQAEENPFPVRYVWQENGGKCRAINHGLELAAGEMFFTVDSDDYLLPDALENAARWESELPQNGKFCAVSGNLGTAPGQTPNAPLPQPYYDGTALDRYGVVKGERALLFYTQVHREYLYPVCEGERFMTEAVAWNRMAADGWKIRFYNEILTIYEYREDGLTSAGDDLFWNNLQGTGIFFREKAEYLHTPLHKKLAMWYGYATEAAGRLTDAQIADYIGMPRILVPPVRWIHSLVQLRKRKR